VSDDRTEHVFTTQHSGRRIPTANPDGTIDGSWQRLLTDAAFGQLSLVVVTPATLQGWYIHGERSEWHVCIKGQLLIAQAGRGAVASSAAKPIAVEVPSLVPHGLYNAADVEAWVLVLSDLPHTGGEDEWPLPVADFELDHLAQLWHHYYGS
jgi:hypothetical protein